MKNKIKLPHIIIASFFGTLLEWYDFFVFAFLTPIISKLFFPQHDAHISLLLTYSIFAVGFFTRPLGGFFFGHLGDKLGRKKTLIMTIALMTIPTVSMGLLPTAAQIGLFAPLLLLLLRALQGFSVGGETVGSIILAFESAPEHKRAWVATLAWAGTGCGILLASGTVTFISSSLTESQLMAWGWRIPLLLGLLTGALCFWIRLRIRETPQFQALVDARKQSRMPLKEVWQKHKTITGKIIFLYAPSAVVFFLVLMFMPSYVSRMHLLPYADVMRITTISMFVSLFSEIGMGWLADRVGRRRMLRVGLIAMIVFSVPLYHCFFIGSLFWFAVGQMGFVFIAAIYISGLLAGTLEIVPTRLRYSIMASAYNLTMAIFSGTAPIVIAYLAKPSIATIAPVGYLIALSLVAITLNYSLRLIRYNRSQYSKIS